MIRPVFPSCSPSGRFHRSLFFLISYLTLWGPPGVYPDRVGEADRSSSLSKINRAPAQSFATESNPFQADTNCLRVTKNIMTALLFLASLVSNASLNSRPITTYCHAGFRPRFRTPYAIGPAIAPCPAGGSRLLTFRHSVTLSQKPGKASFIRRAHEFIFLRKRAADPSAPVDCPIRLRLWLIGPTC